MLWLRRFSLRTGLGVLVIGLYLAVSNPLWARCPNSERRFVPLSFLTEDKQIFNFASVEENALFFASSLQIQTAFGRESVFADGRTITFDLASPACLREVANLVPRNHEIVRMHGYVAVVSPCALEPEAELALTSNTFRIDFYHRPRERWLPGSQGEQLKTHVCALDNPRAL